MGRGSSKARFLVLPLHVFITGKDGEFKLLKVVKDHLFAFCKCLIKARLLFRVKCGIKLHLHLIGNCMYSLESSGLPERSLLLRAATILLHVCPRL